MSTNVTKIVVFGAVSLLTAALLLGIVHSHFGARELDPVIIPTCTFDQQLQLIGSNLTCVGVNCTVKYFGTRNLYNSTTGLCMPVPQPSPAPTILRNCTAEHTLLACNSNNSCVCTCESGFQWSTVAQACTANAGEVPAKSCSGFMCGDMNVQTLLLIGGSGAVCLVSCCCLCKLCAKRRQRRKCASMWRCCCPCLVVACCCGSNRSRDASLSSSSSSDEQASSRNRRRRRMRSPSRRPRSKSSESDESHESNRSNEHSGNGSRAGRSPRRRSPRPAAPPLHDERQPARSNRLSQRLAAMIAQALARHDRQPPATVLELPRTGTDVFTVEMSSIMGQSSADQPSVGQPLPSQSRRGEAKQEPIGRARDDEGARRVTSWRARR